VFVFSYSYKLLLCSSILIHTPLSVSTTNGQTLKLSRETEIGIMLDNLYINLQKLNKNIKKWNQTLKLSRETEIGIMLDNLYINLQKLNKNIKKWNYARHNLYINLQKLNKNITKIATPSLGPHTKRINLKL
jgi:hypothetical protein